MLALFEIMFEKFGHKTNEKAYQVLSPQVQVIQGDGVNYDAIQEMYAALKNAKISAENSILGMSGSLKPMNRGSR